MSPKSSIWSPIYRFLRVNVQDEAHAQRGLLLNGTLLCFGLAEVLYLILMIFLFQPLYIIELTFGIAVTATAFGISKRGHVAVGAGAFLTVSFLLLGYVILTSTNYQIAYGPCAIFLTFF